MTQEVYDGIRVWRGYRSLDYTEQRDSFIKQLKEIFIPQTAQQMMPLGLNAYFPAIVPETQSATTQLVPDEVALVVYPSAKAYETATQKNVAGRAYSTLHSTVFNFSKKSTTPNSTSDSPEAWQPNWYWNTSYSLIKDKADWSTGTTRVLLAQPSAELNRLGFYRSVNDIVNAWRETKNGDVDAGILCVELNWLLYWEHSSSLHADTPGSLIEHLLPILERPLLNTPARLVTVPPAFSLPDDGVECKEGELLNVKIGRTDSLAN